jgi:hypothetical protein
MEFTRHTGKQGDLEPIRFSTWKEVLVKEPLSSFQRDLFCEACGCTTSISIVVNSSEFD